MIFFAKNGDNKESVEKCKDKIEVFFRKIKIKPITKHVFDGASAAWSVKRGKATIYMHLIANNGSRSLRFGTPICRLPEDEGRARAFYRKCLEKNIGLPDCALGVSGEKVCAVAERPIDRLSPKGLEETLDSLSKVSQDMSTELDGFDAGAGRQAPVARSDAAAEEIDIFERWDREPSLIFVVKRPPNRQKSKSWRIVRT